jgi:amidohydrolase
MKNTKQLRGYTFLIILTLLSHHLFSQIEKDKIKINKVKKPTTTTTTPTNTPANNTPATPTNTGGTNIKAAMDKMAESIQQKVITWRRDFHQNPELSNREFNTAKKIETHLRGLGNLEVRTGIAKTGVVGILRGGKPGPTVALRADIDALPVTERVPIPFASKVRTTFNDLETGVMHACGHDTHTAILMGAAEVMSKFQNDMPGTIVFIFQPAEEGAPRGETGGAGDMIKEGVLDNPKVEAIFGLHINSMTEVGKIRYRPMGTMASSDGLYITVKGKQTHGANPWNGVDPIVVSSQIVMGLQTIVSRMTPLNETPAVVTIGSIHGGIRGNIIPEEVKMTGTIRCLDPKIQKEIHANIEKVAKNIAESAGAEAIVTIDIGNPVTYNNPELTKKMVPTLEAVAGGEDNVQLMPPATGAEDFSLYQQKIPGFFYFLGGMPKGKSPVEAAPHHTPDFYIDESGFTLGVKSFHHLVLDYAAKK